MAVTIWAIIAGLHPYFQNMAAPLLFANSVATITDVREGFENLNIMGSVPNNPPRAVEYGNAAMGGAVASEDVNYYENYACHLCGKRGHISRMCPGPPTCPPLPRASERACVYGRDNQRGRGGRGAVSIWWKTS